MTDAVPDTVTSSLIASGKTSENIAVDNGANNSISGLVDMTNQKQRMRVSVTNRLTRNRNNRRCPAISSLRQSHSVSIPANQSKDSCVKANDLHHHREKEQQKPLSHPAQCRKENDPYSKTYRGTNYETGVIGRIAEDEEYDSWMSAPNQEMTNLVLLRRQHRHNVSEMVSRSREKTISKNISNAAVNTGTEKEYQYQPMSMHTPSQEINGYHFTTLSDGTPVYNSLLTCHSMTMNHNRVCNSNTVGTTHREEDTNDSSSSKTVSISLTPPKETLHAVDEDRKGILVVNRSSVVPLAQLSTLAGMRQESSKNSALTDSRNVPNASRNKANRNGKLIIDEAHQISKGNAIANTVPSGKASSSITSSLSTSFSSIDINPDSSHEKNAGNDQYRNVLQHEKKRKKEKISPSNQKKRYNKEEETTQESDGSANTTRFKDIIGHQSVKLRLDEVLLPLALPPSLSRNILKGIRALPASILLYGPPGCGKTQIAKAVAGEANAAFLSIGPSDILSKYVGESEEAVRSVFAEAVRLATSNGSGRRCTVLFFDEIDALGQSRGTDGNGAVGGKADTPVGKFEQCGSSGAGENSSRRILAELLIQLTKINTIQGTYYSPLSVENEEGRDEEDENNKESKIGWMEEDCNARNFISSSDDSEGCHGEIFSKDDHKMEHHNNEIETSLLGSDNHSVRVIVIAATNRPEDCDPALIRRFAVQIQVGLPKAKDRKKMLKRSMEDIDHKITKKQFLDLSLITEGWSGSDIQSLAREAAMAPIRECIRRAALLKRRRFLSNSQRGKEMITDDAVTLFPYCKDQGVETSNTNQRDENECANNDISSAGSQKRLLEEFRNLRPVHFQDYVKALHFSFSRMYDNLRDSPLAEFGWIEEGGDCFETNDSVGLNEHYDSSSDEEDEEEVISISGD